MHVAIHPWIGYETLYLAEEFGWLPENVSLTKTQNATQSIQALKDKRVGAAALTLDEVILARSIGVPLTVVMVFDISAGADVLMASDDINAISELKGKRIGVEETALGSLVLASALKAAGLSKSDVEVINVTADNAVALWEKGTLDAVITYEPSSSKLERLGAKRIFDSRDMPDTIFDVLAIRSDLVSSGGISELVAAHFKALEQLRINREDTIYRIAGRQQVTLSEIRKILNGVNFPTVEGQYHLLGESEHFKNAFSRINTLMLSSGVIDKADSYDAIFTLKNLPRLNYGQE